MKSTNMLPLALALSLALFATACDREADDAVVTDPAVTAEPAVVEPAPVTTPPAAATATTPLDSGMDFATMDANSDGGVTQDELNDTEMLYLHFSVADTDGDGRLSPEEVDAHRAAMADATSG